MYVSAKPRVISQVPAIVVGILVEHDLVRIPEPRIGEAIVVGSEAKVVAGKPEPLRAPSQEPEDMTTPEAARKASMLPEVIEMVVSIVTACSMSDPQIV